MPDLDFDRLRLDWFAAFHVLSEEDRRAWLIEVQIDFDQLPYVTMEDRKDVFVRHAKKIVESRREMIK